MSDNQMFSPSLVEERKAMASMKKEISLELQAP